MAVLIKGETLYVAWLGDSQVLLSKAGQPCLLMNPHKPNREVTTRIKVFFLPLFHVTLVTWRETRYMLAINTFQCVKNSRVTIVCIPNVRFFKPGGRDRWVEIMVQATCGLINFGYERQV